MSESDMCCWKCVYFHYDEHTDEKYGEGMGWCELTGTAVWCEKVCPLFSDAEETTHS